MKKYTIALLFFILLSSLSNKKTLSISLKGKYIWQWTMEENKLMLIRSSEHNPDLKSLNHIEFKGKSFSDIRTASCGNDILYHKTGLYSYSKNRLILNYTGGNFSDNTGGDSVKVYVKTKVYYDVTRRSGDTIFLYWKSGSSVKNVSKLKIQ